MEFIVNTFHERRMYKMYYNIVLDCVPTEAEPSLESYKVGSTNNYKFAINVTNGLDKNQIIQVRKAIKQVKDNHIFLHRGDILPITQLRIMSTMYDNIQRIGNVFFIKENCISQELMEFAHVFASKLKNYERVDGIHPEHLYHCFGIKGVGLIKDTIKLENDNGRLYLTINDIEHHMEHENAVNTIIERMNTSEDVEHLIYQPLSNQERINLKRIKEGYPPVSFFGSNSNNFKFKLSLAFTQLCKSHRVPHTPLSIRRFINQDFVYVHYTNEFRTILLKEAKSIKLKNYCEESYDNMENALSFLIYLNGKKKGEIRSTLLYNRNKSVYTVCYDYSKPDILDKAPNILEMKKTLLRHIHPKYNQKLESKSIEELFDYSNVRGTVTHPNLTHIHHDGGVLPITYHNTKYRPYNHNFKQPIVFDRQNTYIKYTGVIIAFKKGKVTINDVIIIQNVFCSEDKKNTLLDYVYYLWNQGYLLSDYGHIYYNETNNILPLTIKPPEWFTVENSSVANLLKFLRFNFPEVSAMATMS